MSFHKWLFNWFGIANSDIAYKMSVQTVPIMVPKVTAKVDPELDVILDLAYKYADEEALRKGHEKYQKYYRFCMMTLVAKAYSAKCTADIASAKGYTTKAQMSMAITAGSASCRIVEYCMERTLSELAEQEGETVPVIEILTNIISVFDKKFDNLVDELEKFVNQKYEDPETKPESTKFTEL
jgi:superoxide dismutase